MAERTCLHCGQPFEQTSRGPRRSWCYDCLPAYQPEDKRNYDRKAAALHKFKRTGNHGTCCPWRPEPTDTGRAHRPYPPCPHCGIAMTSWRTATCASPTCRAIRTKARYQAWRQTTTGQAYRRRHQTTRTRRRIKRIGTRDNWICHLCLDPIDHKLPYPNPAAPSVDHLVPLSHGGPKDDPTNMAIAHLACNWAKGNRWADDPRF
jgi:hypothetical protein